MAYIKKNRARKELVSDRPTISISNMYSSGLRFNIEIGDFRVSLSHYERDEIIKAWELREKEFINGKV